MSDLREPTVRLSAFGELTASELAALAGNGGAKREISKGETLWNEGDRLPGIYLLLDGWTASTISFGDGGRQFIKAHMPGDMLGFPDLALENAAETMTALTQASVIHLPLKSLRDLFENHPRIAAMLFLVSQEERVHLIDRLAAVARTSTIARVAAMIIQLHTRVLRSMPNAGDSFYLPLRQNDLADLVGVSTVHINRTLKQLDEMAILKWSRQRITIMNRDALQKCAGLPIRRLSHDQTWLPTSA